jgi:hypothetical protein
LDKPDVPSVDGTAEPEEVGFISWFVRLASLDELVAKDLVQQPVRRPVVAIAADEMPVRATEIDLAIAAGPVRAGITVRLRRTGALNDMRSKTMDRGR